jgi:hypothetical protein
MTARSYATTRATLPALDGPTPVAPLLQLVRGTVVINALPAEVNLNLYAGDDFTLRIDVSDAQGGAANLTGAVPKSQIRATAEAEQVAGEFVASVDEGDSAIYLHLTSEVSTGLPARAVWDVQITQGGRVMTLARGVITMMAEVTR